MKASAMATIDDSRFFAATAVLALALSGCGGSNSTAEAILGQGTFGETLTLSGFPGVSTITGLTYNSIVSNAGTNAPTNYLRIWSTVDNTGLASLIYQVSSTEETLNFDVTADTSVASPVWYYAATTLTNLGFCHVSGTTNVNSLPDCSALNITISRSAGTITFASTPARSYTTSSPVSTTGTLSGSLTFPPF